MSEVDEKAVPHKRDLPVWHSGGLVRVVCLAVAVAAVVGPIVMPGYRFGRFGIVDGVLGLVLGLWLGSLLTNLMVEATRLHFTLLEAGQSRSGRRQFSPLDSRIQWLGAASIIACVAIDWVLESLLHLRWPWCEGSAGAWSAFMLMTVCLFAKRYGEWYDSLPD